MLAAYAQGLISQQTALKELSHQSRTTGVFTTVSDKDIQAADAEVAPSLEELRQENQERQDEQMEMGASGAGPGGGNDPPQPNGGGGGGKPNGKADKFEGSKPPEKPKALMKGGAGRDAAGEGHMSKAEAGYEAPAPGIQRCVECDMFVAERCNIVEGPIDPAGVCDYWEPIDTKARDGSKADFALLQKINEVRKKFDHAPFSQYEFASTAELKAVIAMIGRAPAGRDPWEYGAGARDAAYRAVGIDPSNPNPDGSDYHLMNAIDARRAKDALPRGMTSGIHTVVETRAGEPRWPGQPPIDCDYGYVRRVPSAEGPLEWMDALIGPNADSPHAWVVDKYRLDGSFDEHKLLLGFDSSEEGVNAYHSVYREGHPAKMTHAAPQALKRWLDTGDVTRPYAEQQRPRIAS